MNASDQALQLRAESDAYIAGHYPATGNILISSIFTSLFTSVPTAALIFIERASWWLHIAGIFGFALYITYSKHLHIFLAFPNTYYADLEPRGYMANMPEVTQEVKIMLGVQQEPTSTDEADIPSFGADDVTKLRQKNIMDAFSCTECGRCTESCPANITGKKLSPRKIMMDVRDRAEHLAELKTDGSSLDDGQTLLGNHVSKEEINACTTCNACVEACPVSINPLDIILQMRRHIAMEESGTPASWNAMFANIENNGAPWAFPASDRMKWNEGNA